MFRDENNILIKFKYQNNILFFFFKVFLKLLRRINFDVTNQGTDHKQVFGQGIEM